MSLYLKYRPQTLQEIKGNNDAITIIENMLGNLETCPHTFLLHGPTGCGKTTIARIIANRLGCKGGDLNELNNADFRGIDTVRDINHKSFYKSLEGNTRVWIMDECQKLGNDAQNALLKILEDTPKHVYFILCTTEPQKLINTIRGRCIQIQLTPLNGGQMYVLLRKVVKEEGQKLEQAIFDQIIQDSLGLPRNALQILEAVLNTPLEKQLEVAKRTAEQQSEMIELCRALVNKAPWKTVSTILTNLKEQDPESIRRVVLGYCQAILLKGKDDKLIGFIMEMFMEPTYNTGFPQIVFNCYSISTH